MAELTPEELAALLAELDAVIHHAQELSDQIKHKMAGHRREDHIAEDWSDRRQRTERRRKRRA